MTVVWLWTVTHGLGLVVWAAIFFQAWSTKRYRIAHGMPNGDAQRLLHEHMRTAVCLWTVHAVFFYTGLRVLFDFDFGAIPYLFVAAGLIMLLAAALKLRDRTLLSR